MWSRFSCQIYRVWGLLEQGKAGLEGIVTKAMAGQWSMCSMYIKRIGGKAKTGFHDYGLLIL